MFRKVLWGVSRHGRKVFEKFLQKAEGVPKRQTEVAPTEGVTKACRVPNVALTRVHQSNTPQNPLVQVLVKYAKKNLAADLRRQFDKSPLYREYRGLAQKLSLFGFVGVGFASRGDTEDDRYSSICDQIKDLFQSKADMEGSPEDFVISGLQNYQLGPMIAKGCSAAVYQARNKIHDEKTYSDNVTVVEDDAVADEDLSMESDSSEGSDIEVISDDEGLSYSFLMNTSELDTDAPPNFESDCVMLNSESDEDISLIDDNHEGGGASVMFMVTCQKNVETDTLHEPKESPESKEPAHQADFDLAIKMLFNYDTESNASALYREMRKELLPIKTGSNSELLGDWENGHRAKEKGRLPPHPNIVDMRTAFVDDVPALPGCDQEYPDALPRRINPEGFGRNKTLFLVMKRYPQTLREYVACHSNLPMEESLLLLTQLVEAVVHLGRHGVAHRDLKSDNIFVDDSGGGHPQLVVSDFGECLHTDGADGLRIPYVCDEISKGGNMTLMAPEIRGARAGPRSFLDYTKSDLWTVGTLAYEIYGQSNPFYTTNDGLRLCSDTYNMDDLPVLPDCVPRSVQKVIEMMLQKNHQNRPSPVEVSAMLHVILWGPEEWSHMTDLAAGPQPPSRRDIMRWLLIMFARVSCEKALGLVGVKPQLRKNFLQELNFEIVTQAVNCLS